MSKGRIIEQGTHSGLIAQGGTYARFVEIQNLTVSGQEKAAEEAEIQDEDDAKLDSEVAKTLTRYGTADRKRLESQMDRDKYENHAELGFIGVIWRFVKDHPDLRVAYICSALGCLGGCKSFSLSTSSITD
jgi:ATP-binding cassette, subfamily B (MDR/TAP), member 1